MSRSAFGLFLLVLTRAAAAQDCRPGKESNEARTMATFGVPLAFSLSGAPERGSPWQLSGSVELSYLPKVDDATATPTICRPDKPGPENTDLIFALLRPRLLLTLPGQFAVEGSWIPPIRIGEAKANLFGLSVSRVTPLRGERLELVLRAHSTLGKIEGPITCDDVALTDSASPCYQGTRSNDAFRPNLFGIEGALSWTVGRFHPYLGAGYTHLAPRFQVNFINRFGDTDRTRVVVNLDRAALFGGATWQTGRLGWSGEVYSAPADAVTARVRMSYRIK